MDLKKNFVKGERVQISSEGGWPEAPHGSILGFVGPVSTLQGEDYFYHVRFDEPSPDFDGDGPYISAEILSRYINSEAKTND